ncbi:MAG TPA: hypothetical protein VNJ46_10075 [Gaiellaceae bacterium]|nr:hypothetical protein [Gaiellaceae bacterium]
MRAYVASQRAALLAALTAAAAAALSGAGAAGAAFPGENGKIAFTSNRDGNLEVYVMNADGSGQANLSDNAAADLQPAWSPDGSKIAFTSDRDGNLEVYVMNAADGSGQANLSQNDATLNFDPAWSPDGSKIAFTRSFNASAQQVYVMNADGSGQTNLSNEGAFDEDPAWQTLPSADLALGLAASPDVVRKGRPLTYTITVQNAGPSNAADVVVTDPLPPETRFVSAQPSKGSCLTPPVGSTGTVVCDLGFLPNGEDETAQIVVRVVVRKTTVSNTASVASSTPDPNPANNSATIATTVK